MRKTVQLTIDGHVVEADSQETILDVSNRTGYGDVPTLCYSPLLPPYGSCFVCIVEVEGARTLPPACSTRARAGMVVHTKTDRVRQTRKMALELLLSAHWADCLGPCQTGCPAGVDAQGYLALAHEGRFEEAVELIKRVNPLPIVCGRVCVRACEVVCERQRVDEPVGINFVKRYAAELERGESFRPVPKPSTGKTIAIVGSGPAGLTCAYYLALEGVRSVILEAWPQPGGMLRYGIPEYRLPKRLLDLEIGTITRLGVDIRTNQVLGRDFSLGQLRNEYDAVFVAVGAPKGKKMRLEGEDEIEGVLSGLDFLTRVEMGAPLPVHGRVVVVGGGNTAIDAARTAFRLGADEVIILYRRTRKEMPADEVEIIAAEEEGVDIQFLAAPIAILSHDGELTGVEALRMELGEPDASGRRRPVPIVGSEFSIDCDFLFGAIGQDTDLWWAQEDDPAAQELSRTKWNTLVADERTMATNLPGVFAGGDVQTGPTVVIDAIRAGGRAARGILSYLRTGEATVSSEPFYSERKRLGEPADDFYSQVAHLPRSKMPEADPVERRRSWDEAELGLEEEEARYETERCLVCGCLDLGDCELQRLATEYEVDPLRLKGEVVPYRPDESHSLMVLDNNKCILCGKCVTICRDLVGPSALGFVSRGFATTVKPVPDVPLSESPCIACGNCIDECPTGALMEKLPFRKLREWRVDYTDTLCTHCGVVCDMKFASVAPGLFWIQTPEKAEEPSIGQLCKDGRFGHRYLSLADRIAKPLVRVNGEMKEATWDEALKRAATVLQGNPEGTKSAVIGNGFLTLEEAYLLQDIARGCLDTHHVASGSQLGERADETALDRLVGLTASTVPLSTIDTADLIITIGTDLRDTAPVVDFRVHRALERGARRLHIGLPLGHVGRGLSLETESSATALVALIRRLALDGAIDRGFLRERCSGADRLEYHLKNLSERQLLDQAGLSAKEVQDAVKLIRAATGGVVALCELHESRREDVRAMAVLLLSLGKLGVADSGLLLIRRAANEQGLPFVGLHPSFRPGRTPTTDSSVQQMRAELIDGRIASALVVGEDLLATEAGAALLEKIQKLVVLDMFVTRTAESADVVLPISAPVETDGRYISLERRIRQMRRFGTAPGGKATWEVLSLLREHLGGRRHDGAFEDLAGELDTVCSLYDAVEAKEGRLPIPLFLDRFKTDSGTASVADEGLISKKAGAPEHRAASTIARYVVEHLS